MLKTILTIILAISISSCSSNLQKKPKTSNRPIETKTVDFKDFKLHDLNPCESFSIEVENMYEEIEALTPAHLDTAFLDNELKRQGFKTIKSGWGNWANGPRIIELELKKDDCSCTIYKKYILKNRIEKNGKSKKFYQVNEKIVCNASNNGVD